MDFKNYALKLFKKTKEQKTEIKYLNNLLCSSIMKLKKQKKELEEYEKIKKLILKHAIESDGITLNDNQPPTLDKILENIFFRYDHYIKQICKNRK